ncbi:TspO/MBR family protein [Homoserinibacter sp. GY 40078]|uniref:TspO/MBR family protein n=1 Tax=Homoserinibacter sp. GY 40078 TaxID=2603275 RepID=UPI0011CB091C|nr:TspO/MBR family protein [Homoserinibacter sp. GY 40078]TXK17281.1 tryptophan-rich sensory protein [Homoserinibacter sp. GY 40078]
MTEASEPLGAHIRSAAHPGVSTFALLGSIVLAVGVGSISALATVSHVTGWYATAEKPQWTPPDIVFAPVWTVLYLLMAVAAWLVWRQRTQERVGGALLAYGVQLAINAAWAPVFFALYPAMGVAALWLAFAILIAMLLAVLYTILRFWPISRLAGLLLCPYAAWLLFAGSLNVTIAAYAS